MALLNKSGIVNGNTILPEHVTNVYDALNGSGSYDVVATGSFTGTFTGTLSGTASYVDLVAGPNITINQVGTSFQISGSDNYGSLEDVLSVGNKTNGVNIILNADSFIQNNDGTALITFSSNDTINFKSDNNTDWVTDVELNPNLWNITHTNLVDGYIGAVFYDGISQSLYNTVNVIGEDSWGRTIYTPSSVTHDVESNSSERSITVTQGITDYTIDLAFRKGSTCKFTMNGAGITLEPIDNRNVFIQNLPTSSAGLSGSALFTQTAAQLGGSGATKVLCVV